MSRVREAFNKIADAFRSTPVPPAVLLPAGTSLLDVPSREPIGFVQGIEILNDERTTMQFVVSALQDHAGIGEAESVRLMLEIHGHGGVLIPMNSMESASIAASAISAAAMQRGHPLACRAVILASEGKVIAVPPNTSLDRTREG